MAAQVVLIAEAVKTLLNATPSAFSLPFTATRAYAPVFHKEDESGADPLAALTVCVVPVGLEPVTLSRRDDEYTYRVDVAVLKRVGEGPLTQDQINAACDPLMQVVEEIADLLRSTAAIPGLPARFMTFANAPVFDYQRLDAERLFASLLTVTFKGIRPR